MIMVVRDTLQSLLLVNPRVIHYSITHLIPGFTFLGLTALFPMVFRFGVQAVLIPGQPVSRRRSGR
jgi:hypothetical protein